MRISRSLRLSKSHSHVSYGTIIKQQNSGLKTFPNHGGTDFCFLSLQSDTSLHCETTDTGLMHRAVWRDVPNHDVPVVTIKKNIKKFNAFQPCSGQPVFYWHWQRFAPSGFRKNISTQTRAEILFCAANKRMNKIVIKTLFCSLLRRRPINMSSTLCYLQ